MGTASSTTDSVPTATKRLLVPVRADCSVTRGTPPSRSMKIDDARSGSLVTTVE